MMRGLTALAITALCAAAPAAAKDVKIKLGTLAPEGSPWHQSLKRMGQRMKELDPSVSLVIFPGGVSGDEGDMVRKMRIGQLHAATITNVGLGRISRASVALQVPMMIESYEELDYLRTTVGPKIAAELDKEGFVVLNWGDAGWVHFFMKTPQSTVDDFRKLKFFVWSGDPEAERAWKAAKFNTVALSSTDVLASLQSGLIEAVGTAPIYALTAQWYVPAKHMLQINWTPLNGATVVSKKTWEQIDPASREKLLKVSMAEGDALNQEVRKMEAQAIKSMVDRGLQVIVPNPSVVEAWKMTAVSAYPEIRGKVVPEAYFDEVQAKVQEFRSAKKK